MSCEDFGEDWPYSGTLLYIVDVFLCQDMGTIVLGKVESGVIRRGATVTMMPNKLLVEVMQLWSDEEETELANPGENVKLKLKNCEEEVGRLLGCHSDGFEQKTQLIHVFCANPSIHTKCSLVTCKDSCLLE